MKRRADIAAARNAHRAAQIERRIAETLAVKPDECKLCRRCKGARRLDAWAATGSVCARCQGRGYDLTPAMVLVVKRTRALRILAEIEAGGKEAAAQYARRPSKANARHLARCRAQWVEARDALAASEDWEEES